MNDLTKLSIKEASTLLLAKKISAAELTKAPLDAIAKKNSLLNAYTLVTEEKAM